MQKGLFHIPQDNARDSPLPVQIRYCTWGERLSWTGAEIRFELQSQQLRLHEAEINSES